MATQPLAYLFPEFLESAEARPIRILAEYLEPLRRFKEQRIQDTVVFFGSARVDSRERAERALGTLKARGVRDADEQYHLELQRSRKAVEWARYYEEARELSRMLTQWSVALPSDNHRFVVTSGGGPGIMEAANRGAREAGGKTIGLNIRLPFEQGANPVHHRRAALRVPLLLHAEVLVRVPREGARGLPGGFGTCDELFEILTLVQTDKLSKKIEVLLYGRDYWDQVFNFKPLVEWGAITEQDLDLVTFADTPSDAFELLRDHLMTHHLEPPTSQEAAAPGIAKTRG